MSTATATQPKAKGILFTGGMVRAILDNRKTQTRRVVKDAPADTVEVVPSLLVNSGDLYDFRRHMNNPKAIVCPYPKGTLLYVKEGFSRRLNVDGKKEPEKARHYCVYRASAPEGWIPTDTQNWHTYGPWQSPLMMPRSLARLYLRVTDVRVERLQEITESDASAEGMRWEGGENVPRLSDRALFIVGWDGLNYRRPGCSWADNPWLWVVTFERVEAQP